MIHTLHLRNNDTFLEVIRAQIIIIFFLFQIILTGRKFVANLWLAPRTDAVWIETRYTYQSSKKLNISPESLGLLLNLLLKLPAMGQRNWGKGTEDFRRQWLFLNLQIIIIKSSFCISEHFSMILTRCNPMPADMTRRKMIACCFLCAN